MQKGFAPLLLLIGILILIVVGSGAYFLGKSATTKPVQQSVVQQTAVSTSQSTPVETVNQKTYTNTKYGFSLKYPAEWMKSDEEQITARYKSGEYQEFNIFFGPVSDKDHLGQPTSPHATNDISIKVIETGESKFAVKEAMQKIYYCGNLDLNKGEYRKIEGRETMVFKDSPCGLAGSDIAYMIDGKNFYEISDNDFNIDQTLSTFKFLP